MGAGLARITRLTCLIRIVLWLQTSNVLLRPRKLIFVTRNQNFLLFSKHVDACESRVSIQSIAKIGCPS